MMLYYRRNKKRLGLCKCTHNKNINCNNASNITLNTEGKIMRKGLKFIICTTIALGTTILPYSTKVLGAENNKAVAKQVLSGAPVKTYETKKNETNISIDLKIPVVTGIKNKAVQDKINNMIKNDIIKFSNEIEKQANADAKLAKKDKMHFTKYEVATDYSFKYLKDNIMSMTVDLYAFTGGAHGNTNRVPYNINTDTGKNIQLKDLFKKGYNYKSVINAEIKRQMPLKKDMMFFTEKNMAFNSISDNQNYYIKDGKIVIYFSQYEIAPYVSGFPEFEIPVKLFDGNLNTDYKI
jgi:hypothetical protein